MENQTTVALLNIRVNNACAVFPARLPHAAILAIPPAQKSLTRPIGKYGLCSFWIGRFFLRKVRGIMRLIVQMLKGCP